MAAWLDLIADSKGVDERSFFALARHFVQQKVAGPLQQRTFEAVTKLPRKQQRKVLEMVQALVEQYKRKAS
jgi:hypothetical protein